MKTLESGISAFAASCMRVLDPNSEEIDPLFDLAATIEELPLIEKNRLDNSA